MPKYREPGVGYEEPILYDGQAIGNWDEHIQYDEPDTTYRGVTTTTVPPPVPSTVVGEYQCMVADLSGNLIAEIPFLNPSFSYVLNDSGTASFVLPVRHEKCTQQIMAIGEREIYIEKGGSRVWGGHLYAAEANTDGEVRFSCEGWLGRLKRAYLDKNPSLRYVNTEQFDIAWGLIAYYQSQTGGNIGIQRAAIPPSGVKRDRTFPFWERSKIGDELIALTGVARGFDFEITANKIFVPYYPSQGSAQLYPYELGHNISGMSWSLDASAMATQFSALGAGDASNTCIAVATNPIAVSRYGLLQESESMTDIKYFATLQDRANGQLKLKDHPSSQPQLSAFFYDENPFTNRVGDRVPLKADYGFIQINAPYRVISITYELTTDGREAVTVAFDAGAII